MNSAAHQNPVISITSNSGNITDSYKNVWNNCDISVTDEKRAVLEWLSPLEPRERHQTIGMDRMPGVGDWLLLTNEFTHWNQQCDGANMPVLFCYGDPGVGKTYLSSLVIDTLCGQEDEDNMAVACVYCDFNSQEQSATGLFGALLKQVVSALEPIPDQVKRAFGGSKRGVGGRRLLLPEILEMLSNSLSCLRRVFICIDALDEFPTKGRPELWESLQQIILQCPNTRLFLTGRLHIRDEVQKYFPSTADMLPISSRTHDIRLYLEMKLKRDSELDAMDKELESDILRIIPEVVAGTFLLASLNVDVVLAEATIHQRRQALNRMSKGLGLQDAYDTTLDRIRRQGGGKSRLGMEALMWISHCERPLRSEELCHALGVELGAEDFSMQNVPSIRTILGYTLGLITLEEQTSTPRLFHFTLQEYLGQHSTLFVTAHSMMAEICLTYLNSRSVRALRPSLRISIPAISFGYAPLECQDLENIITKYAFLKYATRFWGKHAASGVTDPVKSLALRLLDGYENHVSAALLWIMELWMGGYEEAVRGITGLHGIALWGVTEIAITMLEMKGRLVNACDSLGWTPLMWAIKYKNRGMVKLFLEQADIELGAGTKDGRTVFSFAAELGNADAVKLLLERGDVNPDSKDSNGRTPLSFAAGEGQEGLVKLLLECRDVNPNSHDINGRSPLSFAAEQRRNTGYLCDFRNYRGVMMLLLEHEGVDPNSLDGNCRTPLMFAVKSGDSSIVELLVERGDVDPNLADDSGRTPLSLAAERAPECVVKLLLSLGDVNPNLPDKNGRTPLSFAAKRGRGRVVELLLSRGDANPNSPDHNGRTPLSFAAEEGEDCVVKLLLGQGDVDPNSRDTNGRTPLSFAAEREQQFVVKQLLGRWDVNPDSPDDNGRTPLSFAAERGQKIVVKLLLGRRDVDPNLPDDNGRTPLSFAAEKGEECVMKLLLGRGDVDPNSPDSNGRTPLSFAAERLRKIKDPWYLFVPTPRHEGAVKLLLERGDVDPNFPDANGRTVLSFAAERGQECVVRLLLGRGDVDYNSPDCYGRTPLSFAAEKGQEGVVKLLLGWGDVDPNSSDNSQTPLSFAAESIWEPKDPWYLFTPAPGQQDVMMLPLERKERKDVDPDLPHNNDRISLSFATFRTHEVAVRSPLECDDTNPSLSGSSGQNPPLHITPKEGEGIVRVLSHYRSPDCASSENRERIKASVTNVNASHGGAIYLPMAAEPVTHRIVHYPQKRKSSNRMQGGCEKRKA